MGGGGGKGTQRSVTTQPLSEEERAAVTEQTEALKATRARVEPVGAELGRQFLEALTTGGVGAKLPFVQRGVEETKRATSRALTGTEAALTKSRLAGTPYGERVLAETRLSGEMATAGVPLDIIGAMIAAIPGFVTGTAIPGPSGFPRAQTTTTKGDTSLDFLNAMASLFRTGAALKTAGVFCWIAEAIYGPDSRGFYLARLWIMFLWKGKTASSCRQLYHLIGPQIAYVARCSRHIRYLFKPLFDVAVRRAEIRLG